MLLQLIPPPHHTSQADAAAQHGEVAGAGKTFAGRTDAQVSLPSFHPPSTGCACAADCVAVRSGQRHLDMIAVGRPGGSALSFAAEMITSPHVWWSPVS